MARPISDQQHIQISKTAGLLNLNEIILHFKLRLNE